MHKGEEPPLGTGVWHDALKRTLLKMHVLNPVTRLRDAQLALHHTKLLKTEG